MQVFHCSRTSFLGLSLGWSLHIQNGTGNPVPATIVSALTLPLAVHDGR